MTTAAFAGVGTLLKRDTTSVAEINSISGPNLTRDIIDVTSLDSTGGYREFIPGFRDGGKVTLSCNWARDEWDDWLADFHSDTIQTYTIVLSNDEATEIRFSAYCVGMGVEVPMDDKVTNEVTLKVSGAVTLMLFFFGFQVVNTQVISGLFSTLAGTPISVDWGDGSARSTYAGTNQLWSKDYGSAGNRLVRIYGTQNLTRFTMERALSNVQFDLADLPTGMTAFLCTGSNTVTGDLADLPADMTYFRCEGSNTVTGDLANLPTGMTSFNCQGSNTVTGDLANLPAGLTYFNCQGSNTINAYTGKTWTTKPATFNLRGFSSLDQTEVDNLLVDLDEDLVWAAGDAITILGNCAAPGAAGLAAIANIEAEGATVTVNE
jgi:predicted secreted protein